MHGKIILALIFAVAVQAENPYCQPCKEGFTILAEFFVQEESVERQIEILTAFICVGDDVACVKQIRQWWPPMTRALFATESIVPALCGDIGVCEPMRRSRFYKVKDVEITCEVCGIGIENLARAFQSEKNINRVIDLLSGEAFCTEPSSGYGSECIQFVESFLPMAMPVMAELFLDEKPLLCSDVLGIC